MRLLLLGITGKSVGDCVLAVETACLSCNTDTRVLTKSRQLGDGPV